MDRYGNPSRTKDNGKALRNKKVLVVYLGMPLY